jgi:hypothetical protein
MRGLVLTLVSAACLINMAACTSSPPPPQPIETFRPATRADLSLGILSLTRDPSGFPLPIVNLRSLTEDETIVTYGPNSLTIHCGPYVASGPPATYDIRRELLGAYGYMDFPPPAAGWAQQSPDGRLQLLHPTRLPPGSYDLWATLYLPGIGTIQTPRQIYSSSAP